MVASKLIVAGFQQGIPPGFRVLYRVDRPKTPRGQYERIYVRIEPEADHPAEITQTLGYRKKADILFRRRRQT